MKMRTVVRVIRIIWIMRNELRQFAGGRNSLISATLRLQKEKGMAG